MLPELDKNTIKLITQNISPAEAEYVANVSNVINDAGEICPDANAEDILFVIKIMAFADKFKVFHWAAVNNSYHKELDDFGKELEVFKDNIAENIQATIGQFEVCQFSKIELPLGDDPLDVINALKDCIVEWTNLHKDDVEYEGCRNEMSGFFEIIKKYIYIFRLCKNN